MEEFNRIAKAPRRRRRRRRRRKRFLEKIIKNNHGIWGKFNSQKPREDTYLAKASEDMKFSS